MRTRIAVAPLPAFLALFTITTAQELPIAKEATATRPLKQGQSAPAGAELVNVDGQTVSLASLYESKPLVLVFFRGGWCPICTRHTQQLIKAYPQLKEQGYEMIGISPDSVDSTQANVEKNSIPFPIYSDAQLKTIRGFGLAFQVDDATVTKYQGYGIDLEKASGQTHHALPIPAIYVVNTSGEIVYAHSNPDYRQRLDTKVLLKAVKKNL